MVKRKMRGCFLIAVCVLLPIALGCQEQHLIAGGATERVQPVDNSTSRDSAQNNQPVEDENLAPLPPQIVGGAYLTAQVLCGEVNVPNLELAVEEAPFGCMVVDESNQPIRFSGNRLDIQLTQEQKDLHLVEQLVPYRRLPLDPSSQFAALLAVPKVALTEGITTSVTVTGKNQSKVQLKPALDVQSQAKDGKPRGSVIINDYAASWR